MKNFPWIWFYKRCAILLGIALGGFVLFGLIGVPCLFKAVTGFPCLTCGMSRAWLAAFGLDFSAAFFWHPLFLFLPVIVLLLTFGDLRRKWIQRTLLGISILFLAVYLFRMLFLFPHTPPMDYNPFGFLPSRFGWLSLF